MMSASLQVCPGDLQTAASRISLIPIGMQTLVVSTETRGVHLQLFSQKHINRLTSDILYTQMLMFIILHTMYVTSMKL
jgi:hypothetical protein